MIAKVSKNYCCRVCGNLICSKTALYGVGCCRICAHLHKGVSKNYCCKECGNEIGYFSANYGNGTCAECYCKKRKIPENNPNFKGGCRHCKECGKKISRRECDYCLKCFHLTHKGSKSPGFKDGRYSKEYFCIDCDKKISKISGLYGNHRCNACHCLKLGSNINLVKYNKKSFRSSWEANFAKWCDLSGIKWEYESKTFDLGNCTYTPDFYLPEFDCYIEIKGYWWHDAKEKFNKFLKIYSNVSMLLLQQAELLNMGIIK